MKSKFLVILFYFGIALMAGAADVSYSKIKVLVITGGHDYNKETFNAMFSDMSDKITFEIQEFPAAFNMFLPENRSKYDVLVFYHMWQTINEEQKKVLSGCIRQGKSLVVLHHSICAFDDWEEYIHIVGGKYFHKPTTVNNCEYQPSSYIHDIKFIVKVIDPSHPVTSGCKDFELFDETYKDFYVEPEVTPLLKTDEPTSTPVIGWTKEYGKARVVTLQSGHDTPTFQDPNFRKILLQAIQYVNQKS
jgi:type 1 glutamine amidotransferase